MPAKETVLLTNLFLAARSGSELHTLTLAKQFKQENWDVTCYTLVYAHPLREHFEAAGIKVITFGNEQELLAHYDVFFAQHLLTSEYLWSLETVTFGKTIISILGVATEQEALPFFHRHAQAIVCISEEIRQFIRNNSSDDHVRTPPVHVLPNYAADAFFTAPERTFTKSPRRIAVVSNHPPVEIYDAQKLAASCGIKMDIFGYETRSVEVTPPLLKKYDLVVSIGRTAQCCFASQTPFYCYDHFGGPGYIHPETCQTHALKNFSGRSQPTRRDASELLDDMVGGYPQALTELQELKIIAKNSYRLDAIFEELLSLIKELPHASSEMPRNPSDEHMLDYCRIRCERFIADYSSCIGIARVYYRLSDKQDSALSEAQSISFPYRYDSDVSIDLSHYLQPLGAVPIRFDPDILPCASQATTITSCEMALAPNNAAFQKDGWDHFLSMDSQYNLPENASRLFFRSHHKPMDVVIEDFNTLLSSKDAAVAMMRTTMDEACAARERIEQSTSFKLGNAITRIPRAIYKTHRN